MSSNTFTIVGCTTHKQKNLQNTLQVVQPAMCLKKFKLAGCTTYNSEGAEKKVAGSTPRNVLKKN